MPSEVCAAGHVSCGIDLAGTETFQKNQNNYKDVKPDVKSAEGNLVVFDYKATIDGKDFTGGEGKNTQLVLGKDLFIKGFDTFIKQHPAEKTRRH